MDIEHPLFWLTSERDNKTPVIIQVQNTEQVIDQTVVAGRLAWKKIHTKRILTQEWISEWEKTIPKSCNCSTGYEFFKSSVPPPFLSTSEIEHFEWGWELHNFVNIKLQKPE